MFAFANEGVYKLIVSDALETEDPDLQGFCRVTFKK
jgi:hypothetical protein